MLDLGIRLQLLIGREVPAPAPYAVMEALLNLEVRHTSQGRDVFELHFSLGRTTRQGYGLLRDGLLDPPNRVIIMVTLNALPQVLMDGIITNQQVAPSDRPGQSRLVVTGEDISLKMDFEERSVTHPQQSDSAIVNKIVASYGLTPDVTNTDENPTEAERISTQQCSDLAYVQELAQRNSFVFYVEPTDAPGVTRAYWGPEQREGQRQPTLNVNMGGATNAQVSFGYDALAATAVQTNVLDPLTNSALPIPTPDLPLPSLTGQPASALRTTIPRDTANLNTIQATLRALMAASQGADVSTGRGELDTVRYGRILRARQLVDVRGAGQTHDGTYYVKEVTHRLKRGEYKQSFSLAREGRGAATTRVTV